MIFGPKESSHIVLNILLNNNSAGVQVIIFTFAGHFPAKPAFILSILMCKDHISIIQLWFGGSPQESYSWVCDHFKLHLFFITYA